MVAKLVKEGVEKIFAPLMQIQKDQVKASKVFLMTPIIWQMQTNALSHQLVRKMFANLRKTHAKNTPFY